MIDADFFILGDAHVVVVHYDGDDRFTGAEPLPRSALPRYRACRDAALRAAVSFTEYWANHPEFWRP